MKVIPVRLKERSYKVVVGDGILSKLPGLLKKDVAAQDAIIITNALIDRLHGKALTQVLKKSGFTVKTFRVEDSERAKSINVAIDLISKIVTYAKDKKPVVIAFGGGVVGDLAGFVAAVTKRGVPFVQVPTTLLAQIDSAIGGKVAVDLPAGKNLVGAFYQPKLVLADVKVLKTLSKRQMINGLAEAAKYGVIADEKLFAFMEKNFKALIACEAKAMTHMVLKCAAIKARVVERDEKEIKGFRTILNFGHTVGHAIETAAGYERYYHGEAVALGMRVACEISRRMKLMNALDSVRVNTLLSALGLPERIEGVTKSRVLKAIQFDKKFVGKKNRFVLAKTVGTVVVREGVLQKHILAAVDEYFA